MARHIDADCCWCRPLPHMKCRNSFDVPMVCDEGPAMVPRCSRSCDSCKGTGWEVVTWEEREARASEPCLILHNDGRLP